jgi:hypothetical protein
MIYTRLYYKQNKNLKTWSSSSVAANFLLRDIKNAISVGGKVVVVLFLCFLGLVILGIYRTIEALSKKKVDRWLT